MIRGLDGLPASPTRTADEASAARRSATQAAAEAGAAQSGAANEAEVLPGSVTSERAFALAVIVSALRGLQETPQPPEVLPDALRRAAAALQQAPTARPQDQETAAVDVRGQESAAGTATALLQKAMALVAQAASAVGQGQQTGEPSAPALPFQKAAAILQQAVAAGSPAPQGAPEGPEGSVASVLRQVAAVLQPADGGEAEEATIGVPGRDLLQKTQGALQEAAARLEAAPAGARPAATFDALRSAVRLLEHAAAALASSSEAGGGVPARATHVGPDALQKAIAVLQEAARTFLPRSEGEALQQRLQPIPLDTPASAISRALRELVHDGGALLEAHLAALLAGRPTITAEELVASLATDLRVLLGRLARAAGRGAARRDGAAGEGEAASAMAAALAAEVSGSTDVVAGKVLEQQLRLAHDWVADTALTFEFPVTVQDEERRAVLQFTRERKADGPEEQEGACLVSLQLDSDALGAVNATVRWRAGDCRVAVYVEREATRASLDAHTESLRAGLGTVFTTLGIDVVLDPARATRPAPARITLPPSGAIVSIRT